MILNFYYNLSYSLLFLISVYSLYYQSYAVTGYVTNYDLFSRTNLNDFFTNNYFYWWTVFWYIPSLLLLLLLVFTLYTLPTGSKFSTLGYIPLLIIFLLELVDYWYLNGYHPAFNVNSELINVLLLNSINKYHPLLFYTVLMVPIIFLGYTIFYFFINRPSPDFCNQPFLVLIRLRVVSLFLITFTLFLGSWWALQEGSWGGWWNWDPSEVFGMILMVVILVMVHKLPVVPVVMSYLVTLVWSTCLLSTTYCFIQLNFTLVSHNFGIKSSQMVNVTQVYYVVSVLMLLFFAQTQKIYLSFTGYHLLNNGPPLKGSSVYTGYRYVVVVATVLLPVLYSFSPLINDFLWRVRGLDVLNSFIPIHTLTAGILVALNLYYFRQPHIIGYLTLLYASTHFSWYLLLLLYTWAAGGLLTYLHTLVYLFMFVSFLSFTKIDTHWSLRVPTPGLVLDLNPNDFYLVNFSGYLGTLESNIVGCTNNRIYLPDVGTYLTSTSPDNNVFAAGFCGGVYSQDLVNGYFSRFFIISVKDYTTSMLLILLVVMFAYLYFLNRRTYLVIS